MTLPYISEHSDPVSLKKSETHSGGKGAPKPSHKFSYVLYLVYFFKKCRKNFDFYFSDYEDFRSIVSTVHMLDSY